MANIEKFPLEARGETVSREALVQAALHEITQNYREAPGSTAAAAPRASGPAHEYARLFLKDVLPLCAVHLFLCREVPVPQNLEIAGRLCYYDRNDAVCGGAPRHGKRRWKRNVSWSTAL